MNKGFSLVELIVVIAIMAILVGVAVPVYTSYIDKANKNVETQYIDELERAINTAYIDMKAGLSEVSGATETNLPTKVVVSKGNVTATGAENVDCDTFEKLLKTLITPDTESKYEYTFNLSGTSFVWDKNTVEVSEGTD